VLIFEALQAAWRYVVLACGLVCLRFLVTLFAYRSPSKRESSGRQEGAKEME